MSEDAARLKAVLSMLNDPRVSGLIQSFQSNGRGGVIGSWLGTGPNQAISPNQVASALGDDRLQQLGQATGISKDHLAAHLATALLALIEKVLLVT